MNEKCDLTTNIIMHSYQSVKKFKLQLVDKVSGFATSSMIELQLEIQNRI